jgi:hypothetical protein
MQTTFYILLFISSICSDWGVTLNKSNTYSYPSKTCNQSSVRVKTVDNLDSILEYKNNNINARWLLTDKSLEPDKIYKVVMQDGKVISEKEVSIVPIIKKSKTMIEKETEEIQGYKIE